MSFFKETGLNLRFGDHSKSGVSGVTSVMPKEIEKLGGEDRTPTHTNDLTPKHQKHISHPQNGTSENVARGWDSDLIGERIQRGERVRIWSKVLGEYVLWVRDEVIRACATREYPELVAYTMAELEHLVRVGSRELLLAVHQTKKTFGSDARVVDVEPTTGTDDGGGV